MASWVCNQDGTVFTVGASACPESSCRARDAHEQGGDPDVNVFDLAAGDAEVAERLGVVPELVNVFDSAGGDVPSLVDTPVSDADADMDLPKPREKRS